MEDEQTAGLHHVPALSRLPGGQRHVGGQDHRLPHLCLTSRLIYTLRHEAKTTFLLTLPLLRSHLFSSDRVPSLLHTPSHILCIYEVLHT